MTHGLTTGACITALLIAAAFVTGNVWWIVGGIVALALGELLP